MPEATEGCSTVSGPWCCDIALCHWHLTDWIIGLWTKLQSSLAHSLSLNTTHCLQTTFTSGSKKDVHLYIPVWLTEAKEMYMCTSWLRKGQVVWLGTMALHPFSSVILASASFYALWSYHYWLKYFGFKSSICKQVLMRKLSICRNFYFFLPFSLVSQFLLLLYIAIIIAVTYTHTHPPWKKYNDK